MARPRLQGPEQMYSARFQCDDGYEPLGIPAGSIVLLWPQIPDGLSVYTERKDGKSELLSRGGDLLTPLDPVAEQILRETARPWRLELVK